MLGNCCRVLPEAEPGDRHQLRRHALSPVYGVTAGAQIISVDLAEGHSGGGLSSAQNSAVSEIPKKRPEVASHPGQFALAGDPRTRVMRAARR